MTFDLPGGENQVPEKATGGDRNPIIQGDISHLIGNFSLDKSKNREILVSDMHTLVIEDDYACRFLLEEVLKDTQLEHIDFAVDGKEALDKLSDPEKTYDLVLLDYNMPYASGGEVLLQLQSIYQKQQRLRSYLLIGTSNNDKIDLMQGKSGNNSKEYAHMCDILLQKLGDIQDPKGIYGALHALGAEEDIISALLKEKANITVIFPDKHIE